MVEVSSDLTEFKRFAIDVARSGGELTLQYFRQTGLTPVVNKASPGSFDPVTLADQNCERYIRSRIADTYPTHAIRGEEFSDDGSGEFEWIIDPIDGTRAFISGFTHWGVLLGLKRDQQLILGVLVQPFTEEVFVGDCESSIWLRHGKSRQLKASNCTVLSTATLATTDPSLFTKPHHRDGYSSVEKRVRLIRYGNDCYQYTMLAHGQIDLVMESNLNPWDIQPLVPIVQGAGGLVVNWQGEDDLTSGEVIAAANKSLLDQVLRVIHS